MNHKGVNLPFLETASFWTNVAVIVLTILTALALALGLFFSRRLTVAKDAELRRFQDESKKRHLIGR
jgi:hypothetical protein